MLKPIRETLNGNTEYWDTKEKRIVIGGSPKEKEEAVCTTADIKLDDMDVDQLLSFAGQNNIDVPGNMKKEETIRNHIAEQLAADAE